MKAFLLIVIEMVQNIRERFEHNVRNVHYMKFEGAQLLLTLEYCNSINILHLFWFIIIYEIVQKFIYSIPRDLNPMTPSVEVIVYLGNLNVLLQSELYLSVISII